jgi:tartrate/fumarate subfamily iron-sulfur-dependent hydro-lyase beta chain
MQKINGEWNVRVISITYSMRFDRWAPTVLERTGVRAVIGKGGMGIKTLNTMAKTRCIHLAKVGSFSGPLAGKVKAVKEVHWLDLGIPEAVWLLNVEDFGPFVVAADLQGSSLYDTVEAEVEKRRKKVYEMLGIADFQYAPRGTG